MNQQLLNNEKEVHMKHNKMNNNLIKSSINNILETLWAIGTSITASAVLITFNMSMNYFFIILITKRLTPNG